MPGQQFLPYGPVSLTKEHIGHGRPLGKVLVRVMALVFWVRKIILTVHGDPLEGLEEMGYR